MQNTSSRIEKEKILEANRSDAEFKSVLYYVLNPYIITGLSDKKIQKATSLMPDVEFKNIFEAMEYLKTKCTGTDQIIANIQNFLNTLDDESKEFAINVFTKSLTCGAAAKTVNKIYGDNFIPTFNCMLAEKYFEHEDFLENKSFAITLKLDGIRCLIFKKNGKVTLFSRQGQLIEGLVDIEDELKQIASDNFVLDGELLITNTKGIVSKLQYKATTEIVRTEGEKKGITFRAFDFLFLSDYENQLCSIKYCQRRNLLESYFGNLQYVKILPILYKGSNPLEILSILDKVRDDKQEGIMINVWDAPYEFKRTKNLLKAKIMLDCDLMIIGFEKGKKSGRYRNTLGRVNVAYKGNVIGVGSGFSNADRNYFWEHQEELLGRVITVRYFEETKDKCGNCSLRFPVFKELREEGKEVSYA